MKLISSPPISVVLEYKGVLGQVQCLEFMKGGGQFLSSSDITKRNSTDKVIMVWDFNSVSATESSSDEGLDDLTCKSSIN